MKKELKKTIYESVSRLRNLFIKIKVMLVEGRKQKHQTDKKINAMKTELYACRRNTNTRAERKLQPPTDRKNLTPRNTCRQVLPPKEHHTKILYSDVLG